MSNYLQYVLCCCAAGIPIELQACCFENNLCGDYLPEECIAMGGTPLGEGTVCEAVAPCIPPSADCEESFIEAGCPGSILVEFYGITLRSPNHEFQCTAESVQVVWNHFVGFETFNCEPMCAMNFRPNTFGEDIGKSDCGFIFAETEEDDNHIAFCCGSGGDCKEYHFRAFLHCHCPDDPNTPGGNFSGSQFRWTVPSINGCVPIGDHGVVFDNASGLSQCGLRIL